MDETAGNRNGAAAFFGVELFNIDLPLTKSHVGLLSGWIQKAIDGKETTVAEIVGVLDLGGANAAIKRCRSLRSQLRRLRRSHTHPNHNPLGTGTSPRWISSPAPSALCDVSDNGNSPLITALRTAVSA